MATKRRVLGLTGREREVVNRFYLRRRGADSDPRKYRKVRRQAAKLWRWPEQIKDWDPRAQDQLRIAYLAFTEAKRRGRVLQILHGIHGDGIHICGLWCVEKEVPPPPTPENIFD